MGGSARQSGSRSRTAASVSTSVSPANARRPVSISNSTHPNAQMSVRLSTGLPRACSGLMYAAVPRIDAPPASSRGVDERRRLRPLSASRRASAPSLSPARSRAPSRSPSARTLMFAGFRSRWMMPCSCAASSASAICLRDRQRLVERQSRRARSAATSPRPRRVPSRARVTPPLSSRP